MQSKIKRGKHTNFAINKKGVRTLCLQKQSFCKKIVITQIVAITKKVVFTKNVAFTQNFVIEQH